MSLSREIVADLKALSFVRWDRFVEAADHIVIYGWIDRPDHLQEFVVLQFYEHGTGYITSSARWSERIGEVLAGGDNYDPDSRGHIRCLRVEEHAPDVPNVVRRNRRSLHIPGHRGVFARHLPEQFARWWSVAADRDFGTEETDLSTCAVSATAWDAALETSWAVPLPCDFEQALRSEAPVRCGHEVPFERPPRRGSLFWRCGLIAGHEGEHESYSPLGVPWSGNGVLGGCGGAVSCGCCGQEIRLACATCSAGLFSPECECSCGAFPLEGD